VRITVVVICFCQAIVAQHIAFCENDNDHDIFEIDFFKEVNIAPGKSLGGFNAVPDRLVGTLAITERLGKTTEIQKGLTIYNATDPQMLFPLFDGLETFALCPKALPYHSRI
jgi:hypothetical protein